MMAPSQTKCCVTGCDSTKHTQKLFCMPKIDNLRNLWMSFLVPTSPYLLGLSKNQLMTKRVCNKHFDQTQFDQMGVRIRYSYPCLFTQDEFTHGVPLSSEEYNVLNEHNYFDNRDPEEYTASQEPSILRGMPDNVYPQEHLYTLPPTSQAPISKQTENRGTSVSRSSLADISQQENIEREQFYSSQPSTSKGTSVSRSPLAADISQQKNIETERFHSSQPSTSKGISVSRSPLVDIIETERFQSSQPSTSKGTSVSRSLLADISQQENIETERFHSSQPSTSKGTSVSRSLLADISQQENIETERFHSSQPSTSKGTSSIKQFKAKSRLFIKKTTEIAANSLGQTSAERLKSAQKQAESVELIENFDKLNKKAKAFVLMQLRLVRKNKMARRFSLEEKLFALTLMKQSPKGYRLLEHIFALPSKRTLARLAEKIVFECGINENTINHIKQCTKHWDERKKLCSLVFDEVALTPHLTYNENKDKIYGFVEIAGEHKQKFADHALVFMIRGICSSWRQSIAYYFCAGTVSAPELEKILKEIVPKLFEAGLKPLALVCDQGSTFRSCFKNLRAKTARLQTPDEIRHEDTVAIAGHDLFIFHDPPHLLKGIRNNFLDKDILFEGKRASWEDILYIYELDNKSGHTKALPKLTADHVDPKKMKKMKVKVAAQVLSARTAAMLNYTHALHQRLNTPKETMAATAAVVLFFDELFDSVNGSPGQGRGKLRCAVKQNSAHIEFWQTAIKKLKKMKYIDTKSVLARRSGNPRHVRVPSLEGWIMTLNSFLGLSKLLFETYKVKYFYPRLINQDPLENFFGRIRSLNCRNINPDANTFMYTFKSLVISNILTPQSKFANCEDDDGETLIDLNYLFVPAQSDKENVSPNIVTTPSSSSLIELNEGTILEKTIAEKVRVQTSAYTAGYICRKITKKIHCAACARTYITKEVDNTHDLIKHREYKRLKKDNLSYPNGRVLRVYMQSAQYVHGYLNNYCHHKNIKKHLMNIIAKNCDMSWLGCKKHKDDTKRYLILLIIRLQVHNWCNIINKILKGRVEEKYVCKMHNMHMAALKKYKVHRLRQKATKSNE